MDILLLLAGLALILGGANYLTDGAAALAQRLRVPEFLIGLTIVAVGTSAPELVVSLLSTLDGRSDMAVGNVVGSNLFNALVILGFSALLSPIPLDGARLRRDIPAMAAASLLLPLLALDGSIGRAEGLLLLLFYAGYLAWSIRRTPRPPAGEAAAGTRIVRGGLTALMIGGGLAALVYGGELFLGAATRLARSLGASDSVIAVTLVAGGTSLPELASSLVSVAKGKASMALGNVIGSNIANIALILGICSTVTPLAPGGIVTGDLLCVALSSALLFTSAFTFRRRMLDRTEGLLFLLLYTGYIGWLLTR